MHGAIGIVGHIHGSEVSNKGMTTAVRDPKVPRAVPQLSTGDNFKHHKAKMKEEFAR
jgi:hypothetical protein